MACCGSLKPVYYFRTPRLTLLSLSVYCSLSLSLFVPSQSTVRAQYEEKNERLEAELDRTKKRLTRIQEELSGAQASLKKTIYETYAASGGGATAKPGSVVAAAKPGHARNRSEQMSAGGRPGHTRTG